MPGYILRFGDIFFSSGYRRYLPFSSLLFYHCLFRPNDCHPLLFFYVTVSLLLFRYLYTIFFWVYFVYRPFRSGSV